MSDLEQAKLLLNNTRNYLKQSKTEIYNILKDQKVTIWKDLDLAPHSDVLETVGISAKSIKKALLEYPSAAKKISKQITIWNNEIGNQQADLIGKADHKTILAAAQKIEQTSQSLETLKDDLLRHIIILQEADKKLRQCLSVKEIVGLALILSEKHRKLFTIGLELFNLISNDLSKDASNTKTIEDVINQAKTLETRFEHIEIIGLPRLTEEVLFRYVDLGSSTTKLVKTFVEKFNSRLSNEFGAIKSIDQALIAMQNESVPTLLSGITAQSKKLSSLICGFYHKRQLKGNLTAIDQTLELLNVYQLTLKNKIIKSIPLQIEDPQSKINHVAIASKMTKTFFLGAKGIVRSVKMMVTSLKGEEAINEIELQLILESTITKCSAYSGSSSSKKQNMDIFIDSLIHHFPKPFPYNDLLQLAKSTISTYGKELEHYINSYSIDSDIKSLATVPIPSTLSQLIAKIKKKQDEFKKANEQ